MSARPALRGGLRIETHKARPLGRPIETLPPPAVAVLALDQGSGEPAQAIVAPGTPVRVGMRIAIGRGAAADLHSPVSGQVRAVEPRPTAAGLAACIVVASDGRDERDGGLAPFDWTALDPAQLLGRLAAGGLAGLGGAA